MSKMIEFPTSEQTGEMLSPFDRIRRVDEHGAEYWSARELLLGDPGLGYSRWAKAQEAISRAKKACREAGQSVKGHFYPKRGQNESTQGLTSGRKRSDYHLSRYACYLIALNGDPSKPEVAAAQTYFVVQTRRAELARDQRWHTTRTEGKIARRTFTDTLKEHEVEGVGYAICTESINRQVLGTSTKEYRERNGLAKNAPTRDHCETRQLILLSASEDLAAHRIDKDDARGNGPCMLACGRAARQVTEALSRLYEE